MSLEYYLHAYYDNYKHYGLTQRGNGKPISNWETLIVRQRNEILRAADTKKTDQTQLKQLENAINYFTKKESVNGEAQLTPGELQMIQQHLENTFSNQVELAAEAYKTWGGSGVTMKSKQGVAVPQSTINKMRKSKRGQGDYITNGAQMRKQLVQFYRESKRTMDEFFNEPKTAKAKSLVEQWSRIKSQIYQVYNMSYNNKNKRISANAVLIKGNGTEKDVTIGSFFDDLRDFAASICLQDSLNNFTGKFFEEGVSAIFALLASQEENISSQMLNELVKQVSTSNQLKHMTVQAKTLGVSSQEEFNTYYGSSYGTWVEGTNKVILKGGNDKVDVTTNIGNLSLKNMTSHGKLVDIGLVSSTPLNKAVVDEPIFGYHWLNSSIRNNKGKDDRIAARETANKALKKMLLLYAMAGYKHQQGKHGGADYFMVNNKVTGQTKVYSIENLLSSVYTNDNLNDISVKLNGKEFNTALPVITQNLEMKDSKARIAMVMHELHSITAQVSIRFDQEKAQQAEI